MTKRISVLVLTMVMVFAFAGCKQTSSTSTVVVVEGDSDMTSENSSSIENNESVISSQPSDVSTPSDDNSSDTVISDPDDTTSSVPNDTTSPTPDDNTNTVDIDYEWKSHPEDYKLIAFTFDDGPSSNMMRFVQLLSWHEGAGTFFVNGRSIKGTAQYNQMQNAINYGWDIGNHGDQHLVATIGGANGEMTYDELKADIDNLTTKLESNLKNIDGTPYKVSFYRPPNIKPTANTFKICGENNLAVIWLAHDALDWDTSKTYSHRYNVFKNGIGTWEDGDIILCHETGNFSEDTYKILEELLPEFYRAGYRFCSISELMELRGISLNQISGELNEVDGNRGMVTNILDAAKAGKK